MEKRETLVKKGVMEIQGFKVYVVFKELKVNKGTMVKKVYKVILEKMENKEKREKREKGEEMEKREKLD